MANLTRLSVLIGEADAARRQEMAALTRELGVRHVVQVDALAPLIDALKKQAFDVVICAEHLGDDDGVAVLRSVRDMAPATRTVLMRTNDRAGAFAPDDMEAIDLPFSRLELQGSLHRTAAAHGGLWCEVPELSLTDILQMYHQARRSITVLLSGPIGGRIWLEGGELVDAESNGERGMPALSHLLGAESGLVRTEPPKGRVEHTIAAPFQSVILEAAHKLDERRRDTTNRARPAGMPSSTPSPTPSGPASEFGAIYPPVLPDAPQLRPAMTPPLQAPPSSSSLLYPDRRARRRQTLLATLGVLLGLAVVGAAASYLGSRVAVSHDRSSADLPETAADTQRASSAGARVATSAARAAAPAPSPPSAEPPPVERSEASLPASSARAPRQAPLPSAEAPSRTSPRGVAPASAAPTSFDLVITSKPSRASVSEGGRVLGKTPLRVTISKGSVAKGPREFMVRLAGHLPVKISQSASDSNVDASVTLSPRPVVEETPDGGLYEPEFESTGARSGNPRARQKDLGIRLRR